MPYDTYSFTARFGDDKDSVKAYYAWRDAHPTHEWDTVRLTVWIKGITAEEEYELQQEYSQFIGED